MKNTNGELLLRTVLDSPLDDAPRLVYADWLEEHDRQARARYIRKAITGEPRDARGPWEGWVGQPLRGLGWKRWWCRGFVESVNCTVAEWCGGPCDNVPHCVNGQENRGAFGTRPCYRCHGKGSIPGHGPAVVACQPVTDVRLTDRRPYRSEGGYWWSVAECSATNDASLPDAIFKRLCRLGAALGHPTVAAATVVVSRVCVDWAREEAGLSPVAWPSAGAPDLPGEATGSTRNPK
jgi:uncharacterized protein (TIGR02996 family)